MQKGVVQVTCLGSNGRFGNQLFQYAFARAYAEAHDAVLETPAWDGQALFGLADPPISHPLPRTLPDEVPWGTVGVDLNGWFQFPRCTLMLSRKRLRQWFNFQPEVIKRYGGFPRGLVCHLRRGDYVSNHSNAFAIVTRSSYVEACVANGFDANQIHWVSDESPGHYLEDFMTLMSARVLFRANSTFSWWAATLGTGRVFSPIVGEAVGWQDAAFVEGNWPAVCHYRNIGAGRSASIPIGD